MRSRWLGAALVGLALVVAACGTEAGVSKSSAVKLHEQSSEGFTIAVPDGWTLNPVFGGTLVEVVQKRNPSNRVLFGGLLPVSDWITGPCLQGLDVTDPKTALTWAQCDLKVREQQIPASRAISEFAKQGQSGGIQFQVTGISGDSQGSSAVATVRRKEGGKEMEQTWRAVVVSTHSLAEEGFASAQGKTQTYWDSFAFFTGCSADPGKLDSMKQLCGVVLTSFKASGWPSRRLNDSMEIERSRVRVVESYSGRKGSILVDGYQQDLQKFASDRSPFLSWKNLLAGTLQLQDTSNGDLYSMAQDNRKQHCIAGAEVIGYDGGRPSDCVHDARQITLGG